MQSHVYFLFSFSQYTFAPFNFVCFNCALKMCCVILLAADQSMSVNALTMFNGNFKLIHCEISCGHHTVFHRYCHLFVNISIRICIQHDLPTKIFPIFLHFFLFKRRSFFLLIFDSFTFFCTV